MQVVAGPTRILHVSDDPTAAGATSDALDQRLEDPVIITENSGSAALERLTAEEVDCVVGEYEMPEPDGLGLLHRVREDLDGDVPFVLFTDGGGEAVAIKALNLGADRYVRKAEGSESGFDGLSVAIEEEVRAHRQRRERERVLTELHDAARAIQAAPDESAVYDRLVSVAENILDFDLVAVDVRRGDKLVQAAFSRAVGTEGYYSEVPLAEDTFATRAYHAQETILVEDLRTYDITPADPEYLSALTVPIGELGTFQAVTSEVGGFDDTDQELAELLVGHARETLARLRIEAALRDRKRELERQNERLEEFASIVSHDLRNPLNVARGRLETLQKDCESGEFAVIRDALDRMDVLIQDTLDMARGSRRVTEVERIEVGPFARRCWEAVEPGMADLEIVAHFAVRADRDRFRQVLENLFRNAVEHAGEGVTVRVGPLQGGERKGFFVEDDGPGIPEDERETVFDRGYTTSENGTGFGLAIVAEIVDAHDWNLAIGESERGGTRFEFTGVEVE